MRFKLPMTSLANVWEFPEAIPYPGRPRLFRGLRPAAGRGVRDRLENELNPAL
jgi:hypothetical protein